MARTNSADSSRIQGRNPTDLQPTNCLDFPSDQDGAAIDPFLDGLPAVGETGIPEETAAQATSVAGSAEQLVSSMNEMAASTEQVNGASALKLAMNEVVRPWRSVGRHAGVNAKIQETVSSTTKWRPLPRRWPGPSRGRR